MQFTHVILENWRNFLSVAVPLQKRVFLVGANASGKSNFLDAFRFLRDIADEQGGFQRAVSSRKGVSQIRSLHARRHPNVAVEVNVDLDGSLWNYRLEFIQDNRRRPIVRREVVTCDGANLLDRPDQHDGEDPELLTQTHLEQVNANKTFRDLADFFAKVRYLHIVPQFLREAERSGGQPGDPYGRDFLEQLARTPSRTLESRLRRIRQGLMVAVPNLKELKLERDERGIPHLKGLYEHWRPNAGWQAEDQFSDGTLRLLGLLWALLDGSAPLILEEPELSLHYAVVRHLPAILRRVGSSKDNTARQVLLSTHSADLLQDAGIAPEEVLLLRTTNEDTRVEVAAHDLQIKSLLEGGLPMGRAVLPATAPANVSELTLFGENGK